VKENKDITDIID